MCAVSDIKLGKYRHYKGNLYEVISTARYSEDPSQEFVVYKALYNSPEFGQDTLWVRPKAMFFESVVVDGQEVPRFKLIPKIAISGSLNFTLEMKKLADDLKARGFAVQLPVSSEMILRGELTVDDIKAEKDSGKIIDRAIKQDAIRGHWNIINEADVVLVANFIKNEVKDYIGGSVFLEMGFAHVLNKPIYILNDIPEMAYTAEILSMQPIVLGGDLSKIS